MTDLRPAWLADDQRWADQLAAMPEDDVTWVSEHWHMAGGAQPGLDLSWITFETRRSIDWTVVAIVSGSAVFFVAWVLFSALMGWLPR